MDISNYKLGDYIKDLKCPKCKKKDEMRLVGLYHKQEKSHELECQFCFHTEKVNKKQVEFNYINTDEKKKKKKGKNKEDIEDDEGEE